GGDAPSRGQVAAFGSAWVMLWGVTDWPLGLLSAGYLLTASMIQIIVYYYVVAPLLVGAVPPGLRERWMRHPRAGLVRAVVRRPLVALALLNVTLVVTHVPAVADSLKALQVGTMVMDLLWLGSAVLFWWSV